MRERCPNLECFLVFIFCILTEYRDLLGKSVYSVRPNTGKLPEKLQVSGRKTPISFRENKFLTRKIDKQKKYLAKKIKRSYERLFSL